jgi:DNA-binding response OmpR family regulator
VVPTRQLKRGAGSGCAQTIVILTPKESEVLLFLLRAAGPVSRSDLLGAVWGYSDQADTHTVETHIHSLRRKLGSEVLATDLGGYRLNCSSANSGG